MRARSVPLLVALAVASLGASPEARAQASRDAGAPPIETFPVEAVTAAPHAPRLSADDVIPPKRHEPERLIHLRTDFRARLLASAAAL